MTDSEAGNLPGNRRRWRRLLIALAVLPALFLVLLLVVSLPPVQQKLGQVVAGKVAAALEADVKLERLRFNLFTGTLQLAGFRCTGRAERTGTEAVLDSVSVDLGVLALLRGRIQIESVAVDGIGAKLLLDEKGQLVLPVRLPPSEEKKEEKSELPRLTLGKLSLSRGWLDIKEKAGAERHVEVRNVGLDASAELPSLDSKGTFTIGEVRLAAAGKEPLGETSLSIAWDLVRASGKASAEINGKPLDLGLVAKADLRDLMGSPSYSADLNLTGSLEKVGARLLPELGLAGKIAARVQASGSGPAVPDVKATIRGESLRAYGRAIEVADLVAEMKAGKLEKATLDARLFGGSAHVEAAATVMPAVKDISVSARLDGIEASELLPPGQKGPKVAGRISATAKATLAEPALPSAAVTAELRMAKKAGAPAGTVSPDVVALVSLQKSVARVSEFRLKDGQNSLEAAGSYDLAASSFEGHLDLEAPQIGPYLALAGLEGHGTITANLRGSGTLDRPAVEGQVRGRAIAVSGAAIDRVDLDARVNGKKFAIANGAIAAYGVEAEADADGALPDGKGSAPEVDLRVRGIKYAKQNFPDLHAHATVGETLVATAETVDGKIKAAAKMPPKGSAQAEAAFDSFDLGILAGFLPAHLKDFKGQISGTAKASRPPAGKPEATVRITRLEVSAAGRTVTSPGIEAALRGDSAEIKQLDLSADEGTKLALSGRMNTDGSDIGLRLTAEVPDLSRWSAFAPEAPALAGSLTADLRLAGSFKDPRADGHLSARGIAVADAAVAKAELVFTPGNGTGLSAKLEIAGVRKGEYQIDQVELDVNRQGEKITVTGSGLRGQVRLDASVSMTEPRPVTATVELAALEAGPYARIAGAPKDFEATVSGVIRANGQIDKPESFVVNTEIRELRMSAQERTFSAIEPILAGFEGDRIRVDSFKLKGENASVDISGSLPLKGQSEEKLRIKSLFDLKGLLLFVSSLDRAEGTLSAELDVASSVEKPQVSGKVTLAGGLIDGPAFPAALERLEASMNLTPELVTLEKLSAEIAGGPVSIQGSLSLADLAPKKLDVSLRARDIDLEVIRDMQVRSSADITAAGTFPDISVKGQLRIDDATYIPALDMTGLLKSLTNRRPAKVAEAKNEKPPVNLTFDLAIIAKDAIHLQGNLGELDAGGNLQVKGSPEAPVVLGAMAALSGGSINLLGSKWDVTQARADFSDPLSIDPDILVVATTTKSEEEITVTIKGQASKAQLLLSSSKGRSQADIMTTLIGGGGSSSSALADAAAGMAVRGAASPFLGGLGKSTDVSIVPLPTSPEGEKFLFSVEKDLGRGLTATYFKGMSGETADALEMRWRVSSRVKGRVRQNQDGTLSGGFRIRREFN